jgi:hypothetical protein
LALYAALKVPQLGFVKVIRSLLQRYHNGRQKFAIHCLCTRSQGITMLNKRRE